MDGLIFEVRTTVATEYIDEILWTAGNWVETDDGEAGYAEATSATPAAAPAHFEEIGHCIETVTADG